MKTKSISKIMLAVVALAGICLSACQKEKAAPALTTKSNTVKKSNFIATSVIGLELQNTLFSITGNPGKPLKGTGSGEKNLSLCATVTYDTTTKPFTKTFNYGSGSVCSDGHYRSGELILTCDNWNVNVPNNHITMTSSNFVLDTNQIAGSVTLVNNGYNGDSLLTLTETVALLYTTTTSGSTDTVSGSLYYTWLSGASSSPASNWQFQITGGGCSSDSYGNVGCATIQTPLVQNLKTASCNYFNQGTVLQQQTGQANQTVDFGNPGNCSGLQTVTQNGVQTVIAQNTPGLILL